MAKEKLYYMDTPCPTCGGHGRVPSKADGYRVLLNDQGENSFHRELFKTRKDAKKYIDQAKGTFWGKGTIFTIVAPDGEIVG